MKQIFLFISTLIITSNALAKAPKNIILFIGDGLGPSVVNATRVQFKGKAGKLNLDKFPYSAKVKTYSKGYIVTDSAAGASAMSTGVKVQNGVLGLGPDSSPPNYAGFTKGKGMKGKAVENIMETAQKLGKATGVVTSAHIFHATPAGFYAHTNDRNDFDGIVESLKKSSINLLLGGGNKILSKYEKDIPKKFEIIKDLDSLKDCNNQIIGVFAEDHIPYRLDNLKREKTLEVMTKKALACLSKNKKGFVLMVEGGRIDHALHQRKALHALYETQEFDQTIGMTISYLKEHGLMENTLVLSTADHDTAGLSINSPVSDEVGLTKMEKGKLVINKTQHYSKTGPHYPIVKLNTDRHDGNVNDATHTGVDVDLYAIGVGAEKIHGTIENTDIHKIMYEALLGGAQK